MPETVSLYCYISSVNQYKRQFCLLLSTVCYISCANQYQRQFRLLLSTVWSYILRKPIPETVLLVIEHCMIIYLTQTNTRDSFACYWALYDHISCANQYQRQFCLLLSTVWSYILRRPIAERHANRAWVTWPAESSPTSWKAIVIQHYHCKLAWHISCGLGLAWVPGAYKRRVCFKCGVPSNNICANWSPCYWITIITIIFGW